MHASSRCARWRRQLLGMPGRHDAAARALGTLFGKNHRRRARALGTRLLDKPVGKRAHGVGGAHDQHVAKVPLAQAQVGGEARKEREDKFRREGEGEQVGEFKEGVEAKGEGIGRDPGKAARTRRFGQEREAVAAQEGGPPRYRASSGQRFAAAAVRLGKAPAVVSTSRSMLWQKLRRATAANVATATRGRRPWSSRSCRTKITMPTTASAASTPSAVSATYQMPMMPPSDGVRGAGGKRFHCPPGRIVIPPS